MSLFDKLAIIENKIADIEANKLGLPQRRNLLVRQTRTNHTTRTSEIVDTLILPKPYIVNVSPRYANLQVNIEGADSIFISINDLQVEIPRTFSKSLFLPDSGKSTFILEPPVSSSNQIIYSNPSTKVIAGASFYSLVFLSEDDPTRWKLILRKELDKQR